MSILVILIAAATSLLGNGGDVTCSTEGDIDADSSCLLQSKALMSSSSGPTELGSSFSFARHIHDTYAEACPKASTTLPLGALFIFAGLVLAQLHRMTSEHSVPEQARSVGLFLMFTGMTNYSMFILDSYHLAEAIGQDASYSGELLGIYFAASGTGSLVMSLLLWVWPPLWKTQPRRILGLTQLITVAGCCIYAWIASYIAYRKVHFVAEVQLLRVWLLVARALCGAGQGLSSSLLQVSFARLTPAPQRPAQMTRFLFSVTLGIGLGPIIVSFMSMLNFCPGVLDDSVTNLATDFEVLGITQLVFASISLGSVLMFYPDLQEAADFVETSQAPPQDKVVKQKVIILACMVNILMRALISSGVEAGTAMLLEEDYRNRDVGIIIGVAFLVCLPIKLLIDWEKVRLSVFQWIRLFCGVSLIGTVVLLHRSRLALIFSTVLLFPSLYLSDGMIRGLAQQHAAPTGSCLDQTGTTLLMMLTIAAGRFCGPWVSRTVLQKTNQTYFAMLQIVLSSIFWLVYEAAVVKPAQAMHEDAKEAIWDGGTLQILTTPRIQTIP